MAGSHDSQGSPGSPDSQGGQTHGVGGPWRLRIVGAGLVLAGALLAPAGWVATDVLERDNDFCTACHLSEGVPLHIDLRNDFDARPQMSLAAAHAAAGNAARPDSPEFRCIDCHGGVGFVGRARVKVLAAKDAFWWTVGRFDEPDHMAWPLWDRDCLQCHASFEQKAGPFDDPAFHDLAVHNVELGVDCVECHLAHEAGANPDAYFLHPAHVRSRCARCHPEIEEGAL